MKQFAVGIVGMLLVPYISPFATLRVSSNADPLGTPAR